MLKLCSSLSLARYLPAAAYAPKPGARAETCDLQPQTRSRELFVAGVMALATGTITIEESRND